MSPLSNEPSSVAAHAERPGEEPVDVCEHGAEKNGQRQSMDRRLFMQLLVYGCPPELESGAVMRELAASLHPSGIGAVLYEDLGDPRGFGLLSFSEDPADFVVKLRPVLGSAPFRSLELRPAMTMIGRTYSTGFEPDLGYWLLDRPRETVMNEAWPWAMWYPLRRSGAFAQLDGREKSVILREHAAIGKAYGEADLAHDVRLACHGLDAMDNEFVIGLIGQKLQPLSRVVEAMRKTRQTAEFITQMGPFFVGHARWRIGERAT